TTKFRRKDFNLDPQLLHLLNSDSFDVEAWRREAMEVAEWPPDRRPSIHDGLIASLDEVVASEEWSKKLLDNTEKLLGVEMEAGGVCASAAMYRVPISMLRIVSDAADPSKADDRWRLLGMKTLAVLLKHLPLEQLLKLVRRQ